MANIDAPFGFRPVQTDLSSEYVGKLRKYAVPTNNTALFVGDPVLITGTSEADSGADGAVLPFVDRAGTTGYTTGVVMAIVGSPTLGEQSNTIAANTGGFVLVMDDLSGLFEVQADGSMAVTDVGQTADIIFTHAGSTATGQAGAELDTADIATGTMLVIEGFRQQDRNDLTSANPVALVRFNKHQKRNLTGV